MNDWNENNLTEDNPGVGQPPTDNGASGDPQQLRAELDDTRDRLLRMTAELENYRKRASRELEQERRYAALPVVRDLLPLMDNVQRAIEAAEKSGAPAGFLDGVRLVAQQLETILGRHHATKIEASLGQPFDPHIHEAISQMPSPQYPADTVMAVAAAGYQLHDRVVRPAQVVVSSGPG
ncbi:MAG: nucleotide exchange factor GrpE [Planctomycetes bacterium]|nr:nucleotide exchange factor GrpE [Planctomycetota bacterium]